MEEGRKRVLVIDDSALVISIISDMLNGSDFEVAGSTQDSSAALDKYQQLRPDVVLLDVVMPGARGDEVLAGILSHDPMAAVVMVSSLGSEETVVGLLKQGARHFVQKPFEREDLLNALRKAVRT